MTTALPHDAWTFYYDGNCGFCSRTVQWLRRLDLFHRLSWVAYQSLETPPAGLSWDDLDREAYLQRGDRLEGGFRAFRRLSLAIPPLMLLAPILWLPGLRLVADPLYRLVARNRHRLSPEGCETPFAE